MRVPTNSLPGEGVLVEVEGEDEGGGTREHRGGGGGGVQAEGGPGEHGGV